MRKLTLFIVLCLVALHALQAQITVNTAEQTGNWADYFVNEVLIGTGVEAFNAQFTGDSMQIGEFSQVNSGITIPSGLILSTGDATIAIGPNNAGGAGAISSTDHEDLDLEALSGANCRDGAVLEFDFIPQGDTIRFNYVFASEEYDEYACATVNDAFGFFLSGPGINGPYQNDAINLALVPNTNVPVSINTVNLGVAGGAGNVNNCLAIDPNFASNSVYYTQNQNDTTLQYDGHTVVLEAVAEVVCGDTYHIKLAIGDGSDQVFDSGVFLQGGSFTSNLIEVNIQTVNGDSTINEGCGTADIAFTRGDTSDTSISYITYSGTAINGVDFDLLPDSIILLPGESDTVITINPFSDGLAEGVEYVTISCLSITFCGDTFISTGTMYIYDVPNIQANIVADSTINCPPDSFLLWAEALSGGPPPFTYVWTTTDTLDTLGITDSIFTTLSPNGGVDTFLVAIQDSCALSISYDTIIVTKSYADDPVTEVLNDTLVDCAGDVLNLECVVQFGTNPLSFLWSNGDSTSSTIVTVNNDTVVLVTVTDACGRQVVDTGYVGIRTFDSIHVAFADSTTYCQGSIITINPQFAGGLPPYQYAWQESNPAYTEDSILTTLIQGDTTIYLWVQDQCGREFDTSFFIDAVIPDPLTATMGEFEAVCAGTSLLLDPVVEGGLSPLTYEWSTSAVDTSINFVATVSSLVSVTVTDFCGNQTIAIADLFVPDVSDMQIDLGYDRQLCYGEKYVFTASMFGGGGKYSFEWLPRLNPLASEQFQRLDSNIFQVVAEQSNVHLIRVSDQCGNTIEDSLRLEVEHCLEIPNVVTPNSDGMNDAFYINNITQFSDPHLFIYNRWGQLIFESLPYRNEWVPLKHPSGTYYYVLRSANFPEMRGDLTIINDVSKR